MNEHASLRTKANTIQKRHKDINYNMALVASSNTSFSKLSK